MLEAHVCVPPNIPNDRTVESSNVQRFDMSPETSTIPLQMAESSGSGSWIIPSQNASTNAQPPPLQNVGVTEIQRGLAQLRRDNEDL